MSTLFETPGLNIYMQIGFTLLSIGVFFVSKGKAREESVAEVLCIFTIGLGGWFTMMSGLWGHIIYADEVAKLIGWPTRSGFQMELGFASLGIGAIGFAGFWKRSCWFPFVLAKMILMWGAGFTHLLHQYRDHNHAPSNTGIVVYWDFLFPVLLWGLFGWYRWEQRRLTSWV